MTDKRWKLIKQIFNKALDLDEEERDSFLDDACSSDPELRKEVNSLLMAHFKTGKLDSSPSKLVQEIFEYHSPDQKKGDVVGPFKITGHIGQGGMGNVYLAERADGQFDQTVALKLLQTGVISESQTQRFLAERRILASLSHDNIARLIDGGITENGQPWFAMEYVEGVPIDQYCKDQNLSLHERLDLFTDICKAVQYAHSKLIIHRDIKPSNIMVTENGRVKLLDFGIAKVLNHEHARSEAVPLTRTGLLPLTPAYASPEQIRGKVVTTASDIYQLGIILYELLTGFRPYKVSDSSPGEIEKIICENIPVRPSTALTKSGFISKSDFFQFSEKPGKKPAGLQLIRKKIRGDLDTITMKALRKEPNRRYESAEQMASDIRLYLAGKPVTAHPDSWRYRSKKFMRRHKVSVISAASIALLLIGYAATITWHSQRTQAALHQAQQETVKAEQITDFLLGMFEAADPSVTLGDTVTARVLLERGIKKADELQDQPEVRAQILNVVGRVYQSLGEPEKALPLLQQSNDLRIKLYNETDPEIAEGIYYLGNALHSLGHYRDSFEHFEKAVNIFRTDPGYKSVEYANSLHTIATIKNAHRNSTEARKLHMEALQMRSEILGPDHPDVASSYHEIGSSYLIENKPDSAIIQFEKAMDIYQSGYEQHSPQLANLLVSYGNALKQKGEFEKAEDKLIRSLELRKNLYGINHTQTGISMKNLADFFRSQGSFQEAESLYSDILEVVVDEEDQNHPLRRPTQQSMARLYMQMDSPARAEPLYRDALHLLESVLSPEHLRVLATKRELSRCLIELEQYQSAESLLLEALAVYRSQKDQNENYTDGYITTLRELIDLYETLGQQDQYVVYRNRLSEISHLHTRQ